jgi:putative ABC transport system ATP-binding protein
MTLLDPIPLRCEHLSKLYRQGATSIAALSDFSFEISQREFVAVMGASGSGKSTLLHLLAGLTRPNAGRVLVEGEDLAKLSDKDLTLLRRRRIAIIFQSLNLVPTLTAWDNVALPLEADGAPAEAYRRIDGLLERLGLTERRKHRPDALSGGEQQRVAIARAMVNEPALILADEPTGSLDSANRGVICRLLRRLRDEDDRSIVMVTHEPEVAIWADRVVVLKDGRLHGEFSTAEFENSAELAARYHALNGTTVSLGRKA